MNLLENDSSFSAYVDFTLSETDEEVLDRLYFPLLKSDGFSLYHALFSDGLRNVSPSFFHHDEFLSLLDLDSSRFLKARSRLEALGLLETYRKEEEGKVSYCYRLLPPATPRKFFSDVLLRSALEKEVGMKRAFELKNAFKGGGFHAPEGYFNVSSPFDSVFEVVPEGTTGEGEDGLMEKKYKSESRFDVDLFREDLLQEGLSASVLKGQEKEVTDLLTLYGISEEDGAKLVRKNVTTDGLFAFGRFQEDCRTFRQFSPSRRTESSERESYGDSSASKFRKVFDTITPQEYLAAKYGAAPAGFMLEEVEKLRKSFGFPNPVLNVLLDYSLRQTGGEFNTLFLEKVAYSLSAAGVKDSYDAMQALNARDFTKKQAVRKARRKPTAKTAEDTEEVSPEELKALAKEAGL